MGAILAKFRKEKTTFQVLEKLEEDIRDLDAYTVDTKDRQRRYVGNFLIISVGLYVIGFIVFYFLFFPPTWQERIIYSTPLFLFPFVIILLKRLVTWFYQIKLNKNSRKLMALREDKKKIIEKVMEKETYKVACEILNRFGDQNGQRHHQQNSGGDKSFPAAATLTASYRSPIVRPQQQQPQSALTARSTLSRPEQTLTRRSLGPMAPTAIQNTPTSSRPQNGGLTMPSVPLREQFAQYQQQQQLLQRQQQHQQQRQITPFPIINHNQKGVVEKMVDFLIGEGLNSRYGMVCKQCCSHNGMASQEDYEYASFRCAFCQHLNQARKLRPIAPRLEMADRSIVTAGAATSGGASGSSSSSSTSERESGSDSEQPATAVAAAEQTAAVVEPNSVLSDMPASSSSSSSSTAVNDADSKPNDEKKND